MRDAKTVATRIPADKEIFKGFPYLVTRIVDALHHILLLPRSWDIERMLGFGHKQAVANRLPTCLVLAQDLCIYFREDGSGFKSSDAPRSSAIASEKLAPAEQAHESEELAIRRMELIIREEAQCGEGTTYIMGDLTNGGGSASTRFSTN